MTWSNAESASVSESPFTCPGISGISDVSRKAVGRRMIVAPHTYLLSPDESLVNRPMALQIVVELNKGVFCKDNLLFSIWFAVFVR